MIIDRYAWHSQLRTWHPAEKLQIMLAGMLLSLVSSRPGADLLFFFLYSGLILGAARVRARDYLCLLLVPGFFLAAGTIAIPLTFQPVTDGWWWSAGGIGLGISLQGLEQAKLLLSRALAMMAAMYFCCLTTPLVELVSVLRKLRLPEVLSDLMYLVYRGIYLLSATAEQIFKSQDLRLGYFGWKRWLNSLAMLVAAVLLHSLRRSSQTTMAMLARGPEGKMPLVPIRQTFSWLRTGLYWTVTAAGVWLLRSFQ